MKIQVLLEGGLGNQLFQYALGRSLSLHYDSEITFYKPTIYGHAVKREFQLNLFKIEGVDFVLPDHVFLHESQVTDPNQLYQLNHNVNLVLRGYWQNEEYFKKYEDKIRKDLSLSVDPIEGRLLVQVRRTDYLNNSYHEYCDLNWYKRAISEMEFNEVVFVSDDITWCQENFDYLDAPKTFIGGSEKEQFKGMYSCDRFVISNSSFGWWGAWWTDSKQVICPAVWTPGNRSVDPSRKHWKRLG